MGLTSPSLPLHLQNSRERKRREEEPANSPGKAHIVQEERKIVGQEPEEKPVRKPGKAHTGKGEKAPIENTCKTVISLSRLRTPEKRHVVISAGLLFLEEKNN
jgi:hypothetical protein